MLVPCLSHWGQKGNSAGTVVQSCSFVVPWEMEKGAHEGEGIVTKEGEGSPDFKDVFCQLSY
jgi:hypothetical protein